MNTRKRVRGSARQIFIAILLFVSVLMATAIHAQTVKIAMYGDSTMYGWTMEEGYVIQTPRNAPAQLQTMLQAAGYAVTVENYGVPGITSDDLIAGGAIGNDPALGTTPSWAQQMATTDASIVVVNVGLNDVLKVVNGTETWQHFVANWNTIIQTAQAAGKMVFIETMNPRTDAAGAYESQCLWMSVHELQVFQSYNGAANVGWIDEYTAITDHLSNWQTHLPDGIHPDDTLYTFKASIEAGALTPYLNLINPLPPGYTPTSSAAAKMALVPKAPK